MTDLERLNEALAEWSYSYESLEPVLAAARAYADLLANGERVVLRKSSLYGWVWAIGKDKPRPPSEVALVIYPPTEEE